MKPAAVRRRGRIEETCTRDAALFLLGATFAAILGLVVVWAALVKAAEVTEPYALQLDMVAATVSIVLLGPVLLVGTYNSIKFTPFPVVITMVTFVTALALRGGGCNLHGCGEVAPHLRFGRWMFGMVSYVPFHTTHGGFRSLWFTVAVLFLAIWMEEAVGHSVSRSFAWYPHQGARGG